MHTYKHTHREKRKLQGNDSKQQQGEKKKKTHKNPQNTLRQQTRNQKTKPKTTNEKHTQLYILLLD